MTTRFEPLCLYPVHCIPWPFHDHFTPFHVKAYTTPLREIRYQERTATRDHLVFYRLSSWKPFICRAALEPASSSNMVSILPASYRIEFACCSSGARCVETFCTAFLLARSHWYRFKGIFFLHQGYTAQEKKEYLQYQVAIRILAYTGALLGAALIIRDRSTLDQPQSTR